MDRRWLNFNEYVVQDMGVARYIGDSVAGYMEWFRSVSHSYIIQMVEDDCPPIDAPDAGVAANADVSPQAASDRASYRGKYLN